MSEIKVNSIRHHNDTGIVQFTNGVGVGTNTTTGRDAGISTATGTIMYNTTTSKPQIYTGASGWKDIKISVGPLTMAYLVIGGGGAGSGNNNNGTGGGSALNSGQNGGARIGNYNGGDAGATDKHTKTTPASHPTNYVRNHAPCYAVLEAVLRLLGAQNVHGGPRRNHRGRVFSKTTPMFIDCPAAINPRQPRQDA